LVLDGGFEMSDGCLLSFVRRRKLGDEGGKGSESLELLLSQSELRGEGLHPRNCEMKIWKGRKS